MGRVLMVQGTASSVGKSLLVAGLCRLFARQGLRVAPFKAQNMALNAAVTADGLEIGRAQATQAAACSIHPTAMMNPILLKPEGERRSQVIVLGKVVGRMDAVQYHAYKPALRRTVCDALETLRAAYDMVIIEGAGSPAEINLRDHDLVNMFVAQSARAPVLLVGDIDRGGVFAALVGTMELLRPEERELVAALVINKFRGDPSLLTSGLDFLTARTGKPVLGVLPHIPQLRLADEDSLCLERRLQRPVPTQAASLHIAVLRLPRLANHDDFQPLEHEPQVVVRFTDNQADVQSADLVILPGSKQTVTDLAWLRSQGLADALHRRVQAGRPVLGVCGGCQMLGTAIDDVDGVESTQPHVPGLGLLPLRTHMGRRKEVAQVQAHTLTPSFLGSTRTRLLGYEIHAGIMHCSAPHTAPFTITARNQAACHVADGAVGHNGMVVGTMIHGLFDNDALRHSMLRTLWQRKGHPAPPLNPSPAPLAEFDRIATCLETHLDAALLRRIAQWP